MVRIIADNAGPTAERLAKAQGFFDITGQSRSTRRISMRDDALARAWVRQKISAPEYAALHRYAYHWASGGLAGALQSMDLDRVFAFDPSTMSGLAKSERQQDHRDAYREARSQIGTRPALVADGVACFGLWLDQVGIMLGYQSRAHGVIAAREVLSDAGFRLAQVWKDRDRR